MRLRQSLAVCGLLLCSGSVARADYRPRVVLLQPPADDEPSAEVLARVRGELEAAGYELVVLAVPAEAAPMDSVENSARELHPKAVLLVEQTIDPATGQHEVELWLSDRSLGRTFVQRLQVDDHSASRGAQWLAVQAVELVRARLAELSVTKPAREHAQPSPAAPREAPPPAPEPEASPSAYVGFGFGVLHGFRGLGTVGTPVAEFGASLPRDLTAPALVIDLRVAGAGLGGESQVEGDAGSATLQQAFATLDGVARFVPNSPLQPLLSVGTGVYTLEVKGQASAPYLANEKRSWSGLTSVGAGLWTEPFDAVACVFEAKLLAAWSKTIVRIDEQETAEAGAPMGLVSFQLLAVF